MNIFDVLKEIPDSTRQVIGAIGGFGKDVLQGIARSGASVLMTAARKPSPHITGQIRPSESLSEITSEELTPNQRKFKEFVFGKEPLKSVEQRMAEAEPKVKEFGKKYGVETIEKQAKPISVLGVGLMVGLDFTGYGAGKKDVVKVLAKATKASEVAKVLKGIKVADDLIPAYSKVIAKTSKATDVSKALDKLKGIQETTKAKPFNWRTRQFLTSVKKAEPSIPLKVNGQYIPRSTDRLAIKAKNLIKDDIVEAEKIAQETDDKAVATAAELIKHYSTEAQKTTDKAVRDALFEKASSVAHTTAKNLTEQGRAVQAASIVGRQTPEGYLRFAAKEINAYNELVEKTTGGTFGLTKKIPQLTAEQTEYIVKEFKTIEAMADGTKKAIASKQLTNAVAEIIPSSMFNKIVAVWKAGLLTGLKTSGINTLSNLTHGTTEVIKDIPASIVDSVASLFTQKRTLALTTKGKEGIPEGFKKGWSYLKTGIDERDVGAKLDYKKINFGNSKFAKTIQSYEETIFHLMGAEDQPFYYAAKARSLQSQAIAQAKNNGLKGTKAKSFIDDLVQSPTDEMLKYATQDAEMAVFQNPTTLGKIAKEAQKIGGGAGEIVVPFSRTPASVANQLINYSPIGIVKAIAQNIGKGKFDQRQFSQAIGRGITGSGIMYLGTELFKNGLITLDYPTTERERELWKAEGRKADTIKIGGKWRNINILGPAGFVLLTGGYWQRGVEESGSIVKGLADASLGTLKSLREQTFLRGIEDLTNALGDPERYAEGYLSGLASSVIPTLMGDFAKAFDNKERRTTESFLDRAKAKIPFVRETLEPKIDVLGTEIKRGGNWLETMIDPSRPSKIIDTPVVNELRRLTDAGFKVSPTLAGDKTGYGGLTPEQNTAFWNKAGELLNSKLANLFEIKQYQELDDADKAEMVEKFIEKARNEARLSAVTELLEGLSGQEWQERLSELKAGGLLNRSIFKEYADSL